MTTADPTPTHTPAKDTPALSTPGTNPMPAADPLQDDTTIPPVSFGRLVRVETRKLLNTRTGLITTAVLVLMAVGVMAARAVVLGPHLQGVITISGTVLGTLFPVLGILSVTSEWSHHTAVTTFALEPRRWRVVLAKCFPPVFATVIASGLLVLVAYPLLAAVSTANAIRPDWSVQAGAIGGWVAINVVLALSGVAIGTLLLNAPSAIVVVTMSTVVWNLVRYAGDAGATVAAWFDLNQTTAPLVASAALDTTDIQRLTVSMTTWIVLPLLVGGYRVITREVR